MENPLIGDAGSIAAPFVLRLRGCGLTYRCGPGGSRVVDNPHGGWAAPRSLSPTGRGRASPRAPAWPGMPNPQKNPRKCGDLVRSRPGPDPSRLLGSSYG